MPRSFGRRQSRRDFVPRIIIACEGSKTEPGYFHGARQTLRLPKVQVVILSPPGTDPLSVVRASLAARKQHEEDRRWQAEDRAWAVFDGDEHVARDPANWQNAIQLAQDQNVSLAISNPCFEFWYLLHFQDHSSHVSPDRTRELLKEHLPRYERSSKLFPDPLQPLTPDAMRRARALATRIERDSLPPYSNPSTGVASLVEVLLALKQET